MFLKIVDALAGSLRGEWRKPKMRNGYLLTCARHNGSLPTLTRDRYPHVKRGNFNKVTAGHVNFFKSVLGNRILTSEPDVEPFNVDWLKMVRGFGGVVLKPKTTEEVSVLVKYCNENRLAICPQGGNTGLVGGSVPVFDEIVLSTTLMNQILSLDVFSGVLTCQSGCVLSELDNHLKENGLMMPLDLGAKDSCQIGGNLSTNAGGIRLIKYGSLHGTVLGVEVVLANGEVLDLLSTLKKDNTGYHLKHLFIGSEGTLGIITKVAIRCPAAPKAVNVAFLGLNRFEDVLKTYQKARSELGEIMSSCEMIDRPSLGSSLGYLKLSDPLSKPYDFYMLIETSGSCRAHDQDKLQRFLENLMAEEVVADCLATDETSKIQKLWSLRESIAAALLSEGHVFKYDISLPLQKFYNLVEVMRERLKPFSAATVTGYGHLGDGNLHLNIATERYEEALANLIEPYVFEWTKNLRGSVSAEHGIGFKKAQYLHFSKTAESIRVMRNLKTMFDPEGILNPYKVLPS